MKIKILSIGICFAMLTVSCSNESKNVENSTNVEDTSATAEVKEPTEADKLVRKIATAHNSELFMQQGAIQFDLDLMFGGKSRFNGTITMTPNGSRVKMTDSSNTMLWDGKKSMILPDTTNEKGVEFALLTWSYFFAAPYKLADPGTFHEFLGEQPLNDKMYPATKLTFNDGVGQTPDDWYIVYKDKDSDLLAAMAYIVTAGGTSIEEAEEDPHAITYEAYADVMGIQVATKWNFWTWNKAGELNKLLGSATISNVKFIKKTDELFSPSV